MTSEQRLGISPQPPESCPIVDGILGVVENIRATSRFYDVRGLPASASTMRRIAHEVELLRRDLESLRAANEAIRRWGQEWKDLAKRLSRSQNPESIYRQPESPTP